MVFWSPHRFRRLVRLGRVAAFALAIACQIGSGALAMPGQPPRTALAAAMVLCLGGTHAGKDGQPPAHRHLPELAIAAISHHHVQPAAILDEDWVLPPPPASLVSWTGLPNSHAPPAGGAAAFYPTGPPPA